MYQSVHLGFCPVGKFVFSHEDALRHKRALEARLRHLGVRFTGLDDVLPDGLVRSQEHVSPAVEHFARLDVDGVFTPHCNFGTEGAAALIARRLGRPLLLWGPRDEAPLPDGTRLRDTLCGLFATSGVLHRLSVPFSYIENCRLDDAAFDRGLDAFLRAVRVADAFRRGIRIGHIGQRIDFFWSTIVNEGELLDRFNVEVLPIDMTDFMAAIRRRALDDAAALDDEIAAMRETAVLEGFGEGDRFDPAPLRNVLAVRDEMLDLVRRHDLEGLAVQDFMSLVDAMGAWCFHANSAVSDRCALGCESDIHGAVTTALLRRAALDQSPAFLVDFTIRHPTNNNGVLLWHAGAPLSMLHPDDRVRLDRHWILPSALSGMTHFRLREEPVTLARFDGDERGYVLAAGEASPIEGPETQNNYLWVEVRDWPEWERRLIQGPFIHHVGMAYGRHAGALVEACRFVPGLEPLPLPHARA